MMVNITKDDEKDGFYIECIDLGIGKLDAIMQKKEKK
jgi:hypothetical protein